MENHEKHLDQDLDIDLDHVWQGIRGEIWGKPLSPMERITRKLVGSAAIARVMMTSPFMYLAWITASVIAIALGLLLTVTSGQPLVPLMAPLLAIAGVTYAYGPGADSAWELSRTMPVSASMLLPIRVAFIFTVSTIFTCIGTFFSATATDITMLWLLPMVALSLLAIAIGRLANGSALGGVVSGLIWFGIVLEPLRDQLQRPLSQIDMGVAVSGAAIRSLTPIYLLVSIASIAVMVFWQESDLSRKDRLWKW